MYLTRETFSLATNSTTSVSIPGIIPHVVASDSDRSILSIVWSCIATLFACAWVAVHPDLPGLEDDGSEHYFHRIKLLVWVLISPEAVLVWAWRQHRGAQALRYKFNQPNTTGAPHSEHWNLKHGHFLQMGGFVIGTRLGQQEDMFIATAAQLEELSVQDIIEFPGYVRGRDIDDRSKRDGLAYFVAIGQLLWFVTQCIARLVAGLSITLFELVAASFAPITIIMYVLWWRKPQSAQTPIVILVKPGRELPKVKTTPEPTPGISLPIISWVQQAIKVFEDMLGTTHRSQYIPPESKRLPPFYAYPHEHNPSKIPDTPIICGTVAGTLFGIIHILGWNFEFPTRIEKLLWRSSSVILIVTPLLAIINVFVARKILHDPAKENGICHTLRKIGFGFVAVVLTLGYITARLILLVVMCSSLRELPGKQVQGVDWITDIPHIW